MNPVSPLSGIRVLDLTHHIAGPYCTKLFADLGADVIKIERPETGDAARGLHPLLQLEDQANVSTLFLYLNTNKKSVCLDLKEQADRRKLRDLAGTVDILVENFRPGTLDKLGLGYRSLERLNPGLVVTSISNFGQNGPYRDYEGTELTLSALTGMMYMTGTLDREPLKLALSQAQYTAGVTAATASLAAHRHSRLTGLGQHIDVSIIEPMLNTIHQQTARYSYWGRLQLRESYGDFPHFVETANGWLHISALWVEDLKDFINLPELDDPRFENLLTIRTHMDEFRAIIEPWFRDKDGLAIFHQAQERGVSWAPVHDEAALLECPQLTARDFFVEIEHPDYGRASYPGRYFVSDQIPRLDPEPAPRLGQHTEEVFNQLSDDAIKRAEVLSKNLDNRPGAQSPGRMPLAGIRILTPEHWAALPNATKYLASLGAEVITVESPSHPYNDPRAKYTADAGGLYQEGSRNKRAISLDLGTPEGVELFKRLVETSDVVADNFSPRVMKNFGLDYEALREVKSDIVVMSLSGYGNKGPWYLYRGYAVTTEAASGLVNLTGYEGGRPTRPGGTPFGDIIPGLHCAWSILAALEYRNRTGEGSFIDMSMIEPCVAQLGESIVNFSMTGTPMKRMGNRDPNAAPSGCYRCKGEDNWVAVAARDEKEWKALVEVMGNPAWALEERFREKESRMKHQEELDGFITGWTTGLEHMEAMKLCQAAGVPAGAVLNVREAMSNEHYLSRGSFEVVQHTPEPEGVGNRLHIGQPWKFSRTPPSSERPAAYKLGQDNNYVYGELLGMTGEEITRLEKEGVISRELTGEPRSILIPPDYFGEEDEEFMRVLGLQ
ncbi:MAG: CoA transferase [Deltaproteobacteria bacterium]|nr:CoA transferase [Deltaproteobacteria bacterium]